MNSQVCNLEVAMKSYLSEQVIFSIKAVKTRPLNQNTRTPGGACRNCMILEKNIIFRPGYFSKWHGPRPRQILTMDDGPAACIWKGKTFLYKKNPARTFKFWSKSIDTLKSKSTFSPTCSNSSAIQSIHSGFFSTAKPCISSPGGQY